MERGRAALLAALARDPISAATCLYYTYYMVALGRAGEAVERVRRVVEADPLAVSNRVYLAWMLMASGRGQESDREWRQVVELDENYHLGWGLFGLRHFARGDTAEAIHCLEKAYSLAPWDARVVGSLAGLLARAGDIRRAEELLAGLGPVETYGVPRAWAAFHLLRGETEKLMDWFEKMIDQRDPAAISMSRDALRSSPRWPALAKRMNLPESAW